MCNCLSICCAIVHAQTQPVETVILQHMRRRLINYKSHAKSLCRLGRIVKRAKESIVDIVDVAGVAASNQRMKVMHRIKAGQNRVCRVAVFSLVRFLRAAAHDAENPVKYQELQHQQKIKPQIAREVTLHQKRKASCRFQSHLNVKSILQRCACLKQPTERQGYCSSNGNCCLTICHMDNAVHVG